MKMTRSYDNQTWVAEYFPFAQPVRVVTTKFGSRQYRWALGYSIAVEPNGTAYEWLTEGGWFHFDEYWIPGPAPEDDL